MTDRLQTLQTRIDYRFQQLDRLELALTHGSVAAGIDDNQRLEFLGDAVLGLIIAESLFAKHPEAPEGLLDHMRATIVNGASLAQLARKLEIGAALMISAAHRQHLPEPSNSMLEDALEAIIGAIYLDGGYVAAQRWVCVHFNDLIDQSSENSLQANPKGRLQ
jgi:ribonuclease-3